MAKKRPSSSADHSQPIVSQLERIGDELNLIRTVLDELRSDFQWAVQNGRLTIVVPEQVVPIRFHEGDQVEVRDSKGTRSGEIVEMDHAIDRAWVATGPDSEVESVAIESMTKQQQDIFTEDESPSAELPDPGSLF